MICTVPKIFFYYPEKQTGKLFRFLTLEGDQRRKILRLYETSPT
jgi:hypothetical protein